MKELKCPKCGNVFQVDEADYDSIVSQVKNAEFNEEVNHRLSDLDGRHKVEQNLAVTKAKQTFKKKLNKKQSELSEKDSKIERLKGQLKSFETQKKSEMVTAMAQKDQKINQLKSTIEQSNTRLELAVIEERNKGQQKVRDKKMEISNLRSEAKKTAADAEGN